MKKQSLDLTSLSAKDLSFIMAAEALKTANEVGFPLKVQNGLFFPAGKTPKDFLVGEK